MSYPPHLPAPSCNIEKHRKWQSLKIILVATAFGLISGVTGASILLGWIWPNMNEGDIWVINRGLNISRNQLDRNSQAKMQEKIFGVYKNLSASAALNYLANDDKLADAVLVTSDGWAVAYLPENDSATKDWVVLGERGILYKAQRSLRDKRTGLIFLKLIPYKNNSLNQEQFKVVNFNEDRKQTDGIFVFQDNAWRPTYALGEANLFDESHLDTAIAFANNLNGNFKAGSIAIDNQGRMMGFVAHNNLLLPSVAITRLLPGLQDKKTITQESFGVEGWFDAERPIIINGERKAGFFVFKNVASNVLKKGDVILEVNGRPAIFDTIWYNINDSKVRMKVLRGGKEIEVEANVVEM